MTMTETTTPAAEPTDEAIWAELAANELAAAATDAPAGGQDAAIDAPGATDGAAATDTAGTGSGTDTIPTQREGGGQPAGDAVASSAPETARAATEAAQPLDHASRSDRGRISAYQRQIAELKTQLAALQSGAASKATATSPAGQTSDDVLKALKDEYPEVGGPVAQVISSLQAQVDEARAHINQRDSAAAQRVQDQVLNLEEQALAEMHPDWVEVTARPEFATWLNTQPRYVIEAIQRNANAIADHTEAADIIGRFKATLPATAATTTVQPPAAPLSARRQQQLEGAAAPPARGAPKVTTGVPDDPEAAWRYWAEQDRRKAAQAR
jgi:hypothetical protein